jgi:chemotaxis protein CheZ
MLERAEPPLKDLIASLPAPAAQATAQELGGVQTPDKALKQDDVDDLLASLGF